MTSKNSRPWGAGRGRHQPSASSQICIFNLQGRCRNGVSCRFLHKSVPTEPEPVTKVFELKKKKSETEQKPLCQYFLAGGCRYGASCHYRHPGQGARAIRQAGRERERQGNQRHLISGSPIACGCSESKASPPRRTRKGCRDSEFLATVVGLDRATLSRRLSAITGKSSLPAHMVFPDSGASLSIVAARGSNFDADPLGSSKLVLIGKQPYASSTPSGHPPITRVFGTVEHVRCVLRWFERTFGVVFLPFSPETSIGQLRATGWGLQGFIAPFHSRLASTPMACNRRISTRQAGLDSEDRALFREIISSYALSESQLEEEKEDANADPEPCSVKINSSLAFTPPPPLPPARMDSTKLNLYPVIGETKAYRAIMPKDQRAAMETFLLSGKRQHIDLVAWSHFVALGPESALDCAKLTKSYERVLQGPSAGCNMSAQLSEALSAELLEKAFCIRITHAEMELKYSTNGARRLDYRCLIGAGASKVAVGVSVTRAVASKDLRAIRTKGEQFTRKHARNLVKRKVASLTSARRNIEQTGSFQRAILHVWCSSEHVAQIVDAEARALANENDSDPMWRDLVVLATVTDFGGVNLRYAYIYRT
mmetsp:Transcript_13216/g.25302  ORF Transcript_13216/g.25302 Transcript_13216/m.25302 type:complete len:597 (-) Transcript_13216:159-1949(-)|eukprot:CAMPEP_0170187344 /NCGR_PEP_ID=MMETSP0040_2-20121228/41459_1 /TAXON_ID=641309 /ORGANISM="Lotharella oceanica, Strain CCMP622" /LENGTH=596 /DNA_ID=CAMNT_0010434355 /DNA_START=92 /DNA_END=1882 /DNA_ORIENTATION=+